MTFVHSPESFTRLPLQILDVVAETRINRPADLAAATTIIDRVMALLDESGLVGRHQPTTAPAITQGGLPVWKARRVASFIDDHLDSDVGTQVLSGVAELSSSHFTRAFHRTFGQTPRDYVMGRRLERARSKLLTTRDSLSEIALECGFADQSHMTRLFTRIYGESPARWRRQRQLRLQ